MFDICQINFRSVFRENRRMRKSQVQAQILDRVKRDIIHQPLQLLTGVNVIGMTSSTLGTMSRGAASLSKDDDFVRVRTNQVRLRIHVNFLTPKRPQYFL
jgi:vacuolar protein sorting-associated protein 13A/C